MTRPFIEKPCPDCNKLMTFKGDNVEKIDGKPHQCKLWFCETCNKSFQLCVYELTNTCQSGPKTT